MLDGQTDQPRMSASDRLAWLCIGLGWAASVVLAFLSDGGYHDDALSHYLYARWSWNDAVYLVDEWGRPGQTCLLFPIALFGWTACRLACGVLSAASAWLAWDVARRQGLRRASWVPLLCFAQPLFLVAASTTLAETCVAFYLILALWCLQRNRPVLSAALVSLCFVTRYETLVFLPLWALAMWRCRGFWIGCAVLLWAPVAHNLFGVILLDRWPIEFIVAADHPAHYGAGTLLTMTVKSMATSSPAVAVLALVGLVVRWPGRRAWILPGVYAAYLVTHSLIFALGAYASGGYPRFLVATSPVAAICAAAALGAITDPASPQRRRALVGLCVVAAVMVLGIELEASVTNEAWLFLIDSVRPLVWLTGGIVLVCCMLLIVTRQRWPGAVLAVAAVATTAVLMGYLARPHRLSADARAMRSAAEWLETSPHADAPVIATNIWASHFLDRGRNLVPPPSPNILDGAKPGTVFIWDANHAVHPRFGITPESMANRPEWELCWQSDQQIEGQPAGRIYVRRRAGH